MERKRLAPRCRTRGVAVGQEGHLIAHQTGKTHFMGYQHEVLAFGPELANMSSTSAVISG